VREMLPRPSSTRIRVVLAKLPRLLHDIVHASLVSEPDIELADATLDVVGPTDSINDADVVIVAAREMSGTDYATILYAHSRVRLVAIAGDAKNAEVYELLPSRVSLGELSPQVLVEAIRTKTMIERHT
jgi:hypothetical protein